MTVEDGFGLLYQNNSYKNSFILPEITFYVIFKTIKTLW